jgi:hypothetical protein
MRQHRPYRNSSDNRPTMRSGLTLDPSGRPFPEGSNQIA